MPTPAPKLDMNREFRRFFSSIYSSKPHTARKIFSYILKQKIKDRIDKMKQNMFVSADSKEPTNAEVKIDNAPQQPITAPIGMPSSTPVSPQPATV